MDGIEYSGKRLQIGNQSIALSDEIENLVEKEDIIVLLLDAFGDTAPQNIVAYEKSGAKLWNIEPASADDGKSSPYTGLKESDDRVVAFAYNSRRYEVNTQTGATKNIGFYK